MQKFNSQCTAIKSHCHSRHVGYNELGTQNIKSKSITSKIYICNDKTFFYSCITKQAANLNLHFPEMGLQGFLLALLTCNFNYITTVYAIIGFDCGSNKSNITTLSLLEVGECDLPRSQVHVEKIGRAHV